MNKAEKALEAFLVASARTGDRGALARLVRLRGPRLFAHAVRLLGEREGARDVVQDAWAEIVRNLTSLRDDAAFLPWALRIVSRRVARVISTRQRDRKLAGAYAHEQDGVVAEDGPEAVEASRVRRAVQTLPPEQSATVALFYLEDMSVAEVACALDVPVGTVKTRLMHARTKLRVILEGNSNGQT